MFQGRTSVICGQLLVKYSLQVFRMSRFPVFLEKEELHCKTGTCMHWSNTVGKYIKGLMAHKPWVCYSTKDCALFTSNKCEWKHIASWCNRQNRVTHWYRVQSVPCSAPCLFWSCCCTAPAPCLLQSKAAPAWLAQGSAPWETDIRDAGTLTQGLKQDPKARRCMFLQNPWQNSPVSWIFSTYQGFQTGYFLLGLAQLLENMV